MQVREIQLRAVSDPWVRLWRVDMKLTAQATVAYANNDVFFHGLYRTGCTWDTALHLHFRISITAKATGFVDVMQPLAAVFTGRKLALLSSSGTVPVAAAWAEDITDAAQQV
jgi:hypothetical protein